LLEKKKVLKGRGHPYQAAVGSEGFTEAKKFRRQTNPLTTSNFSMNLSQKRKKRNWKVLEEKKTNTHVNNNATTPKSFLQDPSPLSHSGKKRREKK
jgi:hypothetical protein